MLIVKIVNDGTGTVETGNYRYQVMVNDTVIESGEVKDHNRKDGWRILLQMIVDKPDNDLHEFMLNFILEHGW